MKVIPKTVQELVAKHIHSVDVLEILLLLRRDAGKEWGAVAISEALRLEPNSVKSRLHRLVSAELVVARFAGPEEVFRYQPSTVELNHALNDLANWYSSHRVAIVALIYSNPAEEIRTYPGGGDGN